LLPALKVQTARKDKGITRMAWLCEAAPSP
jgi:hypothetical protein